MILAGKYNATCQTDDDCLKNGECASIKINATNITSNFCRCTSKDKSIFKPEYEPNRQCSIK